jgi:hypothetical protein
LFLFQKINDAVRPLNRIKDILVAGNHPSPGIHGHARASGMWSISKTHQHPQSINEDNGAKLEQWFRLEDVYASMFGGYVNSKTPFGYVNIWV